MTQCLCGIKISLEGNFWSRIKCWQEQKKETFWNERRQDPCCWILDEHFWAVSTQPKVNPEQSREFSFQNFETLRPFPPFKNENKIAQINF